MSRVPEGIRRGRLTDAEEERIVELADRGLGAGPIALKLNRHPVTVGYAMHRLGVRKLARRTFAYTRNGRPVKSFSDDEDRLITALRIEGHSTVRIAEIVTERFGHRRSAHTINVRLVLLSNAEEG
jgi:IS30 family transposase